MIFLLISTPFALLIINMKLLFIFGNEWCTFDKQKGCSNLKALFDDYILSVLCAWKDPQNLMKWL
jgi:hypothetical protein